jgi:hypothetical protein
MIRSDKYFQFNDKEEEGGLLQPHDRQISLVVEPMHVEIPSSKTGKLKGKKIVFNPLVAVEKVKERIPFTRSKTQQHAPIKDGTTETSAQ